MVTFWLISISELVLPQAATTLVVTTLATITLVTTIQEFKGKKICCVQH